MPKISESKKKEIIDALVSCGVTPNEGAIAFVVQHMKDNGRATVKSSCRKYAETHEQRHEAQQQPTGANRSHQSAQVAQNSIQDKITAARDAVRRNTKAQIVVGGISDALADIALGNFDDLELDAIAALDDFTSQLNQSHSLLLEAEQNPVPLSLPASTDMEDAA